MDNLITAFMTVLNALNNQLKEKAEDAAYYERRFHEVSETVGRLIDEKADLVSDLTDRIETIRDLGDQLREAKALAEREQHSAIYNTRTQESELNQLRRYNRSLLRALSEVKERWDAYSVAINFGGVGFNKIGFIKDLRDITGLGLVETKAIADRLWSNTESGGERMLIPVFIWDGLRVEGEHGYGVQWDVLSPVPAKLDEVADFFPGTQKDARKLPGLWDLPNADTDGDVNPLNTTEV